MSYLDDPDVYKAALIVIGNEILSGRTHDKNTSWIAETVGKHGIVLVEVRVVLDIEDKIIDAINALRGQVDYVFTTGGIGPTHDDITAQSVAKAMNVPLEQNKEAYQALVEYYGEEDKITSARAKMSMMPKGASLIPNPVSGAPGFVVENVYVMAGVPRIMQAMFDYIMQKHLSAGKVVLSNTLMCTMAESELAPEIGELQARNEDVDIGSYPHFRNGVSSVSLVFRSTDPEKLKKVTQEAMALIKALGDTPKAMSLQAPIDDF